MSNRYYEHRQEIREVCEADNWPVDIATDIVRKRHGWKLTGIAGEELREWRKMCRDAQLNKNENLSVLFNR